MSDRWVEVDLAAIRDNVRHVTSLLPAPTRIIAVVKADGYGHGARQVARAALGAGAWGLAVSTLGEARELLEAGSDPQRVLVLGGLTSEQAGEAAGVGCAVMCHRTDLAAALGTAARAAGRVLPVHLKVDTGMSRLGCAPEDAVPLARAIAGDGGLRMAGMMTHFAASESDPELTRTQSERFTAAVEAVRAAGIDPGLRHTGNSGAALRHPELAVDAVRVGIAMYGYDPGGDRCPGLRPALSLHAVVTHVKDVPEGTAVGYGGTWRAERPSRIATAAIGYADGVMRARSNRGEVLLSGRRAPLVGRVSMDAITVDVTGIDGVAPGSTATLLGSEDGERITADDIAAWSGTISYEVLTAIGSRVERRFRE